MLFSSYLSIFPTINNTAFAEDNYTSNQGANEPHIDNEENAGSYKRNDNTNMTTNFSDGYMEEAEKSFNDNRNGYVSDVRKSLEILAGGGQVDDREGAKVAFALQHLNSLNGEFKDIVDPSVVRYLEANENLRNTLKMKYGDGILSVISNAAKSDGLSGNNSTSLVIRDSGYGEIGLYKVPHSYSDIYASVIFSKNHSEKAPEADVSLLDLARYPTYSDTHSGQELYQNEVYGQLSEPTISELGQYQYAGSVAAIQIDAMFKYDWLVSKPKNGERNFVSNFFTNMFGSETSSTWLPGFGAFLTTASWGASVFDMAVTIIKGFDRVVTKFSVPEILGFGSNGETKGLIALIWHKLEEMLGLSGVSTEFFTLLKNFIWLFIITSFIIALIMSLSNNKYSKSSMWIRTKRIIIRVIVSASVIPMTIFMTRMVDGISDAVLKDGQIAKEINSRYVLDTLEWAATTNLSFAPFVSSVPTPSISSTDSFNNYESIFEPDDEKVYRLNTLVHLKAEQSGLRGSKDDTGAKDLIEKVASREVATVDDYFSMIRSASSDAQIAASRIPQGARMQGSKARKSGFKMLTPPYFLSENPNKDSANQDEEHFLFINYGGQDYRAMYKPKAPYFPTLVTWNKPEGYIYGAVAGSSPSKEQAEFNNFIAGKGTKQNEKFYDKLIKINHGSEGDEVDDDTATELRNDNDSTIALYNRYAGISTIEGSELKTFSTQSTAFILQTYSSNGSLRYSSVNTPQSDGGANSNRGKGGNEFVRYVIPNTGKWNLIGKIGSLGILWVSAGVCAFIALFYLFKAPIISAITKMFINFFSAFFTGNIIACLEYFAFYLAMKFSFVFALFGAHTGAFISDYFLEMLGFVKYGVAGDSAIKGAVGGITSYIPFIGGTVSKGIGAIPSPAVVALGAIIAFAMTWPVLHFHIGKKAAPTAVSVVGAITLVPYLLAAACESYFDSWYYKIYGKSKSATFLSNMTKKTSKVDHGQVLKKRVAGLTKVGTTMGTGGLGGLAAKTGAALTGVTAAKLAGKGVGTTTKLAGKAIGKTKGKLGIGSASNLSTGELVENARLPIKNRVLSKIKDSAVGGQLSDISQRLISKLPEEQQHMLNNAMERIQDTIAPSRGLDQIKESLNAEQQRDRQEFEKLKKIPRSERTDEIGNRMNDLRNDIINRNNLIKNLDKYEKRESVPQMINSTEKDGEKLTKEFEKLKTEHKSNENNEVHTSKGTDKDRDEQNAHEGNLLLNERMSRTLENIRNESDPVKRAERIDPKLFKDIDRAVQENAALQNAGMEPKHQIDDNLVQELRKVRQDNVKESNVETNNQQKVQDQNIKTTMRSQSENAPNMPQATAIHVETANVKSAEIRYDDNNVPPRNSNNTQPNNNNVHTSNNSYDSNNVPPRNSTVVQDRTVNRGNESNQDQNNNQDRMSNSTTNVRYDNENSTPRTTIINNNVERQSEPRKLSKSQADAQLAIEANRQLISKLTSQISKVTKMRDSGQGDVKSIEEFLARATAKKIQLEDNNRVLTTKVDGTSVSKSIGEQLSKFNQQLNSGFTGAAIQFGKVITDNIAGTDFSIRNPQTVNTKDEETMNKAKTKYGRSSSKDQERQLLDALNESNKINRETSLYMRDIVDKDSSI